MILLIEDSFDVRTMLRDALTEAGYEGVAVADGNAGLEAQRRSPADVVVTDLFMPEKEGLETIAELRTGFSAALSTAPTEFRGPG